MLDPVVIIGIGEMGGVFARGFLRSGHPIYPVGRHEDMQNLSEQIKPVLVLLAVGEADLQDTLKQLPKVWKDRLALLQNELLPRDWIQHGITNPTVISVWFEKKPAIEAKVIIASPVYGPHAALMANALGKLNITSVVLGSEAELLFELVRKNLYILLSNLAGLNVGGNVGELWQNHEGFARDLIQDILAIQEKLVDQPLESEALIDAMLLAFEGDLQHNCMGRSAPARLARARQQAEQFKLELPCLAQL
ncbi:MAG: hypothetical protein Q9O24_03215 [Gammaproteobacteria bacterium]|nr:hypothetical protein [Gammaproteobacteria bacterium]